MEKIELNIVLSTTTNEKIARSGKFALIKSLILMGNCISQYADDLPQFLISIILKYHLAN